MKKILFLFLFNFLQFSAQTYQLIGNPVNTSGWNLSNNAIVNTDFVQLTPDQTSQVGAIKLNNPINLKYCDKWKVEFDFRIDGNGTTSYGKGDGLSFWYISNPPTTFVGGGGLGLPNGAVGFMMGFDIFNNSTEGQMSKVHILYGVSTGNIEYNNTAGSTFHSSDLYTTIPFQNGTYRHVEVNGQVDPANPANWIVQVKIDNNVIVNQSFIPAGAAATMSQGYFGFSAATGAASARHSIKNVKVYVDKVPVLQTVLAPSSVCPDLVTGLSTVDLTSFNTQLTTNPGNYNFTYYVLGNPTPISNPTNFQYSGSTAVNVLITDPTATFCDNPDVTINLSQTTIPTSNATLTACSYKGFGIFDLTTANVTTIATATKKYYPTMANLLAGANEITAPTAYTSVEGEVFVKITHQNCSATSKISLNFYPSPIVNDAEISACFNPINENTAFFNLNAANVTSQSPVQKQYYLTLSDAENGINGITNPAVYISNSGVVYVKVINGNGCFSIAKITLKVIPPKKSSFLIDKIICLEDRTTLDAGPGFAAYEWSTGATTQTLNNVTVGTYWVDLTSDDGCITRQNVNVYKTPEIVIAKIDIKNNIATLTVSGGKAPYQFSLDGVHWQDSNVFTNLPRGQNIFYVKDEYDCIPVSVEITVPNLVNAITPNGDNINDVIDYSALIYKKDLKVEIFDRYGKHITTLDRKNSFIWNGRFQGKKLPTGTYWYFITWNEPNNPELNVEYTGWILLKNGQ